MVNPRLLFSGAVVGIAFLLVIFSAFRITQVELSGNSETKVINLNEEPKIDSQAVAQAIKLNSQFNIKYLFPYPGTLPDNPFYWVKMITENVALRLVQDSNKKSELFILYADKRLLAGEAMILSGQTGIGVSTITKAEKYLIMSEQYLQQLSKTKQVQPIMWEKLNQSFVAHQRVITLMLDKTFNRDKQILQESLELNKSFLETQIKPYLPFSDSSLSSPSSQLR